jgi:adenosylmethionine-8-amino-7-oxononanoate aminotransferase
MGNGQQTQTLVVGGACGECFSGPRLAKLMKPAVEAQQLAMEHLARGEPAPVLSIHTSVAVPTGLSDLISAFEPHLPWDGADEGDWFMSFQIEGASAVWAATDLGTQIINDPDRKKIAVGVSSYHGPGSSSYGAKKPLGPKPNQLEYPVPTVYARHTGEAEADFHARMQSEFEIFLDKHAHEIAVLLCEPQWGSSVASQPWPPALLRTYIQLTQARGIFVVCDEIMCGLGRHCQKSSDGAPTLFLSKAWDLQPDAVTFGKAVAGGLFPLSGVVVRRGGDALGASGRTVLQMHTYAGSSLPAMLVAVGVLREIGVWHDHSAKMGRILADGLSVIADECNHVYSEANGQTENETALVCHGQGLMHGGLFKFDDPSRQVEALAILKGACTEHGVWPYFVGTKDGKGFMLTPLMDIEEAELNEALSRLRKALLYTVGKFAPAPVAESADCARL